MFRYRTVLVVPTAMLLAMLLSMLLATAGTIMAPGARAAADRISGSALDWHRCRDDSPVQCATLRVPIDWARGGATIDIALARRPATDQAARIGTLVYLPGGPGDSGVDQLLGGQRVSTPVAARFDVVSLDPRGTNRSSPVRCAADLVSAPPNVDPDAGARLAEVRDYAQRLGNSCRANTGALIDHIDSRDVARDVDALRAALGERQISLYSSSYGTLAAQLYAELFPHRVRAVVLDSVFDHTQGTRQLVESSVRAAEDAFTAFADWCAGSATCALHGQDVGAVFDELYRRAGRGELVDPRNATRKITPFELSTTTTHAFYEPEWSTLSVRLATLAGQRAPQPAKSAAEAPALAPFPLAVFCADHRLAFQPEQDWQNLWDRLSQIAPHLRTHLAWQVVTLCAGWPLPPTNPQRPPRIHTTPPVLILNSRHDPATSIAWAIAVHRMINGSVLVTYQGSGHGVYLRTECTRTATEHYLIDLTLPNLRTHCPAADPT